MQLLGLLFSLSDMRLRAALHVDKHPLGRKGQITSITFQTHKEKHRFGKSIVPLALMIIIVNTELYRTDKSLFLEESTALSCGTNDLLKQ